MSITTVEHRVLSRPEDAMPEGTFRSSVSVEPLQVTEIDAFIKVMHGGIRDLAFRPTRDADIAKRTPEYYRSALSNLLSNGGVWTLLAAKNEKDEIVGVLEGKLAHEGEAGAVFWVCTDPEVRHQGIAQALYTNYATELREHDIKYMLAGIHDDNEPSLRFHRNYGFNFERPYAREEPIGVYFKDISN